MPRRPGLWSTARLAVMAGALLSARSAGAGTISITTEVVATTRERALSVAMTITNSGDEAAQSISVQAEFAGATARADPRPSLKPGERMEVALELPRAQS